MAAPHPAAALGSPQCPAQIAPTSIRCHTMSDAEQRSQSLDKLPRAQYVRKGIDFGCVQERLCDGGGRRAVLLKQMHARDGF